MRKQNPEAFLKQWENGLSKKSYNTIITWFTWYRKLLVHLTGSLSMFRTVRKVKRTNFTAVRGRGAAHEIVTEQSEEQAITWQRLNLCEEINKSKSTVK